MKTIILLIVIVGCAFFLNSKLPPNDISTHINLTLDDSFFQNVGDKIMYSDSVAKWQYNDWFVIKFACSEVINVKLIATPFADGWEEYQKDIKSCI